MAAIRHSLMTRKGWLAWACALALAVRMLVPTGYMPAEVNGLPVIAICDGTGAQMSVAMPAMPGMHDMVDKSIGHGKSTTSTCPFAIAAMASIGSADIVLLPPAILAPFTIGYILGQPASRLRAARLRPPAQGPPAL